MNPIVAEDLARIAREPLPWHEFDGRTVLITGAAGFLPAYMAQSLLARNAGTKVVGLVRNRARAIHRFADWSAHHDLTLIEQDVTIAPPTEIRADFIIHAASQASPKHYGSDPVGTFLPNVLGTLRLLERAREWNSRRFLFFSSGEVYGTTVRVPTPEDDPGRVDPTDVRSCYAEGKRAGETLCVSFEKQFGVPAVIARPFHTYGPGMRLDDGRVFADFVADVLANRPIQLHSSGEARRAFCYLADATAGFFTVLLKGEPAQAYNVGNEDGETSILELAKLLGSLFELPVEQKTPTPATGYMPSPISRNCPATSKLRALGWRPTTSLSDGFQRTIRSFQ